MILFTEQNLALLKDTSLEQMSDLISDVLMARHDSIPVTEETKALRQKLFEVSIKYKDLSFKYRSLLEESRPDGYTKAEYINDRNLYAPIYNQSDNKQPTHKP